MRRVLSIPMRRPWVTLLVAAAIAALAVVSVLRLEAEPSLKPLFAADDPASQAMVSVLDDFSAADRLLVLVRAGDEVGSPAEAMIAFAERFRAAVAGDAALAGMVVSLAYEPGDAVGEALQEAIAAEGLHYLDDEQFARLQQRLTGEGIRSQIRRNEGLIAAADPAADAVSERVLRDPLRLFELLADALRPMQARFAMGEDDAGGPYIGRDGRTLLIEVRATEPAGDLAFTREFMQRVQHAVEVAEPSGLEVQFAGGYPIAELSERVIRGDMIFSVVCSVILLQLLFLVAYRSPWNFPLTFLPVAGGILTGFGVYALLSTRLTPVTASSGAILAGLGVDYCIHYLSHYHTHRGDGHRPREAAQMSLSLAPALGAAFVTSMIGFIAIASSRVPALQDFAIIGALGLGGAFLGAMLVLPAMLQVCDRRREDDRLSMRLRLQPMVRWIARRAVGCMAVASALGVGGVVWVALAGLPTFETDLTVLQPRPNPALEAQAEIAEHFPSAMESVPVYLEAERWPTLVARAHEVDRRLMTSAMREAGIAPPMSVAMLLPDPAEAEARRERVASIDAERVLADFRAAVDASIFEPTVYADYETFLARLLEGGASPGVALLSASPEVAELLLPRGVFAGGGDEPVGRPRALTLVRFEREIADPVERREAILAVQTALAGMAGVTVTGMDVVGEQVRATIQAELPVLLSVAGAVVVVWLLVVFRRPGRVALTMIPAVFCLVTVAVMMQVTGTRLNPINLLAIPLLAGIGVDDGIFLMSIARRYHGRGKAMLEQFAASCHAITMTSVTTLLAFGSLLLTSTPAIQSLGLVLATGMVACWFASLFLLMPLLIVTHRREEKPTG
ncbi:RND family transporter [Phycisphaerales bacterium AB-hyl4]|uniref:RND family transporter n=1 Tax=Natronomicrosphaera hydrolytica TaxID=3242702 RepID=A0ABV4U246_9BACT